MTLPFPISTDRHRDWNPHDIWVPWSGEQMLDYPGGREWFWVNVQPFSARMKIIDYGKGRSSVTFWLQDLYTGYKYPMFLTDFYKLVLNENMNAGTVQYSLRYSFAKRGANYGIKLA